MQKRVNPLQTSPEYTRAEVFRKCVLHNIQWNLVIKRSDITKPSYNKVILLVPALIFLSFFTLI